MKTLLVTAAITVSSLLLTTGSAAAQPADPKFTPPDWLNRPTAQQLLTVWPVAALKAGRGGDAVISCIVAVTGGLRDCSVKSESPTGMGFGAAAVALAPQLVFKPATEAGVPIEQRVTFPVMFRTREGGVPSSSIRDTQLTDVAWENAPSYADLIAAYPKRARVNQVAGHVSLQCLFNAAGHLHGCEVIREDPKGKDFGRAAKELAKRFKGPARLADGKSVDHDVTTLAFSFLPSVVAGRYDLSKPPWSRVPTSEEAAEAIGKTGHPVQGRVQLDCHVGDGGALTGCTVLDQTLADANLGAQALAISRYMRLALWTNDGLPSIGAHIVVPVVFGTEGPPKPAEVTSLPAR